MREVKFCLFLLLFVLQFSNCSSIQPTVSSDGVHEEAPKSDEKIDEIERHRRLWQEKNISNYDFEIQRYAEGIGGDWNLTFKIRNGKTLPPKKDNKYDYPPDYQYQDINSIEKLFDNVRKCSESEDVIMNVEFDEQNGFPKKFNCSSKRTTGYVALEIKRFEIVK